MFIGAVFQPTNENQISGYISDWRCELSHPKIAGEFGYSSSDALPGIYLFVHASPVKI